MNIPTLKEAFLAKYPKYGIILKRFEKANKCECTWENINKANLARFAEKLQKDCARKSAKTYSQMFKAVLNLYSDVVELPRGWSEATSVKNDVSQNVFLTEDEIKAICKYTPESDTELFVKNSFLMGALTGARHSDYMNFTLSNIQDGFLVYISQKTHIEARIPVSPMIKRILEEKAVNNVFNRELSDSYYNETLREICRKCGITQLRQLYRKGKYWQQEKWKYCSSHTGRRSFATNLYLRNADLYQISRLMGHSSVKQTEGYICCGLKELNPKIMGYFNNFK
jgi:integrase